MTNPQCTICGFWHSCRCPVIVERQRLLAVAFDRVSERARVCERRCNNGHGPEGRRLEDKAKRLRLAARRLLAAWRACEEVK